MATKVDARMNIDPSDSDDDNPSYDHPKARRYSDAVFKNQKKIVTDAEDKVWKNRILKEEIKSDKYCTRINKRTGKRCCTEYKYKDVKGLNTKGFCRTHFYNYNTERRREKKKQNAEHPPNPPPPPPPPSMADFFSTTSTTSTSTSNTPTTTTSTESEDALTLRMKKMNPHFQLHEDEIQNSPTTTTTSEEEKRKKFAEEQAKREKEEEDRLAALLLANAEKRRARILSRLKERLLEDMRTEKESKKKDADGDAKMSESDSSQVKEVPRDMDKDKDKDSATISSSNLSEEDQLFLEKEIAGIVADESAKNPNFWKEADVEIESSS